MVPIIKTDFKEANKHVPVLPKTDLVVPVYFICNNLLYKGEYHMNTCFYAYSMLGKMDCFASATGRFKDYNGIGQNKVCTHWCYVDEFEIETN